MTELTLAASQFLAKPSNEGTGAILFASLNELANPTVETRTALRQAYASNAGNMGKVDDYLARTGGTVATTGAKSTVGMNNGGR